MMKEKMKKGRKKVKLLKLTFRKLYIKFKNKIEISERATYNISLQLKSYDNTLKDEENLNYLTGFKLSERNASGKLLLIPPSPFQSAIKCEMALINRSMTIQ